MGWGNGFHPVLNPQINGRAQTMRPVSSSARTIQEWVDFVAQTTNTVNAGVSNIRSRQSSDRGQTVPSPQPSGTVFPISQVPRGIETGGGLNQYNKARSLVLILAFGLLVVAGVLYIFKRAR
jgi:hypothetical protein